MPRLYTVEFEAQAIATASGDYDLFELDAATDKPIELRSIILKVTSELQEAQEEWLRLRIIRGHTTTGNGTAATPRPNSPSDAAAGFAAETVGSTIASTGTAVNLLSDAFNVRNGYELFKAPLEGFWTSGADLLVVRLMAATADDLTMSGTIEVCEYP